MYGVKVHIESEDILNKLSEEDRKIFNRCIFTDIEKKTESVEISCVLFNDSNLDKMDCMKKMVFYCQ